MKLYYYILYAICVLTFGTGVVFTVILKNNKDCLTLQCTKYEIDMLLTATWFYLVFWCTMLPVFRKKDEWKSYTILISWLFAFYIFSIVSIDSSHGFHCSEQCHGTVSLHIIEVVICTLYTFAASILLALWCLGVMVVYCSECDG